MNLYIAVLNLSLLVVIHELGHAIAAKAMRNSVTTFSVGFGPPILEFTLFSFVSNGEEEENRIRLQFRVFWMEKNTYRSFIFRHAGWKPIFYFVADWLAHTRFCLSALPFGGYAEVQLHPRSKAWVEILRKTAFFLAGSFANLTTYAIIMMVALCFVGVDWTPAEAVKMTFVVIPEMVLDHIVKAIEGGEKVLSGPVGTVAVYSNTIEDGRLYPALIMGALISLSMGILNLLPIPVLDGGHLMFLLVEAMIPKKEWAKKAFYYTKLGLTGVFGVLLIVGGFWITYKDILELVHTP